jgi:hypothetical protein
MAERAVQPAGDRDEKQLAATRPLPLREWHLVLLNGVGEQTAIHVVVATHGLGVVSAYGVEATSDRG